MDRAHRFPHTWKEARRKRAFELTQHGWKQKDIAEAFAVSAAAVSPWLAKVLRRVVGLWFSMLSSPAQASPGAVTSALTCRGCQRR